LLSLYLSLFYRNDNQEIIKISTKNLPKTSIKIPSIPDDKNLKNNIREALLRRPEMKLIKLKTNEQSNQLKYGKNLLQPQLDLEIGASKDQGSGSYNRSQTNNFANITMSIPLQFSEARGKINSAESKLNSIKYQTALLEDQIKVEIDQLIIKILTINEAFYLIEEEVKLAQKLQESELEKFKQGASNFFLVNLREQENANSQATLIEVYKELQNSLVDYKLAIFDNKEIN
jgi:outer membrane protein TolC